MRLLGPVDERTAKKAEDRLRKLAAPHLEPDESVIASFVALEPGEVARKARTGAAVDATELMKQGTLKGFARYFLVDVPDDEVRAAGVRVGWVLTERSIIEFELSMSALPKRFKARLPLDHFKGAARLGASYPVDSGEVELGGLAMASGTVLFFEISPPFDAAFDEFAARLNLAVLA